MNASDIAFWIVISVIVYACFGPILKELIVLAWKGAVYALTGQWVHALAAKIEPEPETDDKGYIINPILNEQIQALEEICQMGEYAIGGAKYKCEHVFIDGSCFWCSKAEHVHSYRNGAVRCATCGGGERTILKTADGNTAIDALEIALEEPSSDTNMDRAMRIGMEFVRNGQARLVKAALEHVGASRVADLKEDEIEPFIQRLLFESMRPEARLSNPGRKEKR